MDYLQTGNKDTSSIEFLSWKAEPFWGGPKGNLLETPIKGEFKIEVFDASLNKLIYSRGFSTLFSEWQFTDEALTTTATFYESIVIPFPKQEIRIRLSRRNIKQEFHVIFETSFHPFNPAIEKSSATSYPVKKILDSGDPAEQVDLVFLPEATRRMKWGNSETMWRD